jgi:hypothetical protein
MRWFRQKMKGTQSEGFSTPTTSLSRSRSNANETHAKEAKEAIKRDGFGKGLKDPQKAKMLMFLYGRGFMATPTKMKGKTKEHLDQFETKILQRKRWVNIMIEGGEATQRLLRVLESEGDKDVTKERRPLFVHNCVTLRRYFQQDGACSFLDGMESKSKSQDDYYFRIQRSGNCFLHAPCVMLAYLCQKYNIVNAAADISKHVRRSLTDEQLYAYIVEDSGGNSVDVLRKLLEPLLDEKDIALAMLPARGIRHNIYDVAFHLKSFGPRLISTFKVAKNFAAAFIPEESKGKIGYMQFDGNLEQQGRFVELVADQEQQAEVEVHLEAFQRTKIESQKNSPSARTLFRPDDNVDRIDDAEDPDDAFAENPPDDSSAPGCEEGNRFGYHAMVLLGFRIEQTTKKKWLLFQNWWSDMQLVEVSDEYFENARGNLVFVLEDGDKYRHVDLANCYSMNDSRVAESNLDRAESVQMLFL